MDIQISVIDNFYSDFEKVRNEALLLNYQKPSSGTWNGLKSTDALSIAETSYKRLADLLPIKTMAWERVTIADYFWQESSVGTCSLLRGDEADCIHFHLRSGLYAAVVYLCSAPNSSFHGISFYQHRGLLTKYCNTGDEHLAMYRQDGSEPSRWNKWHEVTMEPNRAVLFNARYFHMASQGFGNTPDNGRLVNTYCFDKDF